MFGTFTKHVQSKSKVVEDETILILTRIHPISLENSDLSAKTMENYSNFFFGSNRYRRLGLPPTQ